MLKEGSIAVMSAKVSMTPHLCLNCDEWVDWGWVHLEEAEQGPVRVGDDLAGVSQPEGGVLVETL